MASIFRINLKTRFDRQFHMKCDWIVMWTAHPIQTQIDETRQSETKEKWHRVARTSSFRIVCLVLASSCCELLLTKCFWWLTNLKSQRIVHVRMLSLAQITCEIISTNKLHVRERKERDAECALNAHTPAHAQCIHCLDTLRTICHTQTCEKYSLVHSLLVE